MSKSLIDSLFDDIINEIFDEKWKGKRGEVLTERELKLVQLFGRKGKTLRNIYLPKENGETSEIDVIFITQKGIFVFESKNYSGWIFGDEKSQYWTVVLPNKEKNKFYNPVKQNRTHLKWMQSYIGEDIPLFSIIVFSERCELKKITMESEDISVIKRDDTYRTVRRIWDKSPDVINDEKLNELYNNLSKLTNASEAVKAAHVADIERKYKKDKNNKAEETVKADTIILTDVHNESTENLQGEEDNKNADIGAVDDTIEKSSDEISENEDIICQRCGGKLVLRTAKKGENAGKQFYGCENYPKCRFIKNL